MTNKKENNVNMKGEIYMKNTKMIDIEKEKKAIIRDLLTMAAGFIILLVVAMAFGAKMTGTLVLELVAFSTLLYVPITIIHRYHFGLLKTIVFSIAYLLAFAAICSKLGSAYVLMLVLFAMISRQVYHIYTQRKRNGLDANPPENAD